VVIAAKMDRCFRSAFEALATIESFKRRKIPLWLLDLGGDVSGNGISELIMTVLAAVAQFERSLIWERIKDAKRNLRRGNKHQGGKRPFGWRFGEANGHGRARELIPDEAEQAAIADIVSMRGAGATLMDIRDAMRERRHRISHQTVANILDRRELAPLGCVGRPQVALRQDFGTQGNRRWAVFTPTCCGGFLLAQGPIGDTGANAAIEVLYPAARAAAAEIPDPARRYLQ
jgi:hypothetical protein